MAFSSTLTLDDASGDDVQYVLVKTQGDGTSRIDQSSTLALPRVLNIKHSTNGQNGSQIDRHLVQISQSVSTAKGPVQVVANCTLSVPRATEVTNDIVYDAVSNLIDFMMSGGLTTLASTSYIDALLRGES